MDSDRVSGRAGRPFQTQRTEDKTEFVDFVRGQLFQVKILDVVDAILRQVPSRRIMSTDSATRAGISWGKVPNISMSVGIAPGPKQTFKRPCER